MTIKFTKYIDITSVVAGGNLITGREFIGRMYSTNPLIPTDTLLEFSGSQLAQQVGTYFGTSSQEYLRAVQYANWISKAPYRSPQKLGFYRWIDVDAAPTIYGGRFTTSLVQFQAIDNGSFILEMGGISHLISALDFTGTLSLADVAGVIQDGINAQSGTQWTAATVTYNAARGSFDLVGGDAVAATISTLPGSAGHNIQTQMAWSVASGAIFSDGSLAETIPECLENSVNISNNFGAFLFTTGLNQDEAVEAAAWNIGNDVTFMLCVATDLDSYIDFQAALAIYGGTAITSSSIANQYAEQLPMQIWAATDYTARNSVQNYMYQQDPTLTPGVTDTATAEALDAVSVNYYGRTQQNGQLIDFYQEGLLQGIPTDPLDMNVYANEAWLRDACGIALINLLLTVSRVPVNDEGRSQIIAVLQQQPIAAGLNNGTISVGKDLTINQIQIIGILAQDDEAWYQVQTIGYWLNVVMNPTTNQAEYTLIYSKDDVIRKVVGQHDLI